MKQMSGLTYWLPSLLVVLILKETQAYFDPCSELKREIDYVKKMNHRNELLVFQCQEQLKNETHASEVAFRSLKLAEDQFKSKLHQSEKIISSLKKQLEAKEEILKSSNKTQIQLHATIDGLMKTLEALYLKEEEQCEQPKITTPMVQVTFWLQLVVVTVILVQSSSISDQCVKLLNTISCFEIHAQQRITELEGQNYNLKMQLEAKKEFLNLNTEIRKQMRTTIDCQKKKEETNRIEELREKQKQLQTTIDGHTNTEETNNPSIYELREEQKKLQATIDDLRKTLEPYVCRDMFEAVKSRDVKTVKILVKYAKDACNTNDEFRNTPLTFAAIKGHVDVVRVLLEAGANVESSDVNRSTVLHCAAYNGHLDICRLLLDWEAKVNFVNNSNNTPLHYAAQIGYLPVVKLLVERGANVRVKNDKGETPSNKARSERKKDVAEWLDSLNLG